MAGQMAAPSLSAILQCVEPAASEPAGRLREAFIRRYFLHTPPSDIAQQAAADLAGAAGSHLELAASWRRGPHAVRALNPTQDADGWHSPHTIVEVVTRDQPFLVDSITMVLNQHGFTIHLVIHPVIHVRRGRRRELLEILDPGEGDTRAESFIHVEVDRETDPDRLDRVVADIDRALNDAHAAVEDWPRMKAAIQSEAEWQRQGFARVPVQVTREAAEFLAWLLADNFTILGVREYLLTERRGRRHLRVVPGTGLGILRERRGAQLSRSYADTPQGMRREAQTHEVVITTKSNSRSTVHRNDYLDYVGIKRFDANGKVRGELRILGLYTSRAILGSPRGIPIVRGKIDAVVKRAGYAPDGHDGKALLHILETYPRAELFEAGVKELTETALGILHLQERQTVRLFIRPDSFGRYYACQVFVPRDQFDTRARLKIQAILMEALRGERCDFTVSLTEMPLARLYYVIRSSARSRRRVACQAIEERIAIAVRPWTIDLQQALICAHGEEVGLDLWHRYGPGFEAGYQEDHSAADAVTDIDHIEQAHRTGRIQAHIALLSSSDGRLVFKLFRPRDVIELSAIMPVLACMGVDVRGQRPYQIRAQDGASVWVHDYECRIRNVRQTATVSALQEIFAEAITAIWYGDAENDGLNALVLRAAMPIRRITVLRAYCRYLRQINPPFSMSYVIETVAKNPLMAHALVELFEARFRADRAVGERREKTLKRRIEVLLDAIESLDEDRILRSIYTLIKASVRTNYFQRDVAGAPKAYLSIKILPGQVPDIPLPRPAYEIFVYSPRVEAVHLRGGKVARGGIRWSDRREDFRTEVLGLIKAQTVKNAVIVPVGAKGGFFVKQPPADRKARLQEGIECYRTFIQGLLDITDNYLGGRVVPPPDVVRHDEDDPYLVVAADKGTATFSDIANEISARYGFWLADAFASGGSAGYDHKRMGITARGAWESVSHHFQVRDLNPAQRTFTVVGIGDMSGDVFGNGMLMSNKMKLIGAFNHQHIFVDPDPDPAASFRERRRLFRKPGSTWAEYNPALLSAGGAVFERSAKSLTLSREAQRALGVAAATLTPDDLIKALLQAPVDLIWNGGIGTYVKARSESHADTGDKANDRVRVNGAQLRARMVAEGGNLGFTQAGRIEYAAAGGALNADWIDNSGGVDCSDHEVNIKILLNALVARGALELAERNRLLVSMQEEVAAMVLFNNHQQARAISYAEAQSRKYLDWYRWTIERLQGLVGFDRELERLPDDATLNRRKEDGKGLYRPELATLIAYAKIALSRQMLDSDVPDDEYLHALLTRYFPSALRERFAADIPSHPLRREIVATVLSSNLINHMGITFVFRVAEESGASITQVVRAYLTARDCLDLRPLWREIDQLDFKVPFAAQSHMTLITRRTVERATRWLVTHHLTADSIGSLVARFKPMRDELLANVDGACSTTERAALRDAERALRDAGVPADLAARIVALECLDRVFALGTQAERHRRPVRAVAAVGADIDERLGIVKLRELARALPADNIWQDRARGEVVANIEAFQSNMLDAALANGGLQRWSNDHEDQLKRIRAIIGQVGSGPAAELSKLLVLSSQLRGVLTVA
jgi:glutamate dehydrogenase